MLVATGTDKNSGVTLRGDNPNVRKSLQFLREYNRGDNLKLGKHVAIIGAGNTAMDCARAALRVPGVEQATIVYRRSQQEMPAWREEFEEAQHDGVAFRFLNNPERYDADGTLTLRVMTLGEPDEKGRRRPVDTPETCTLQVDTLITAIGEQQDSDALAAMGIPLDEHGWPEVAADGETRQPNVFLIGDVQRGPRPSSRPSAMPGGPRTPFWRAKISSVTMLISTGITSTRRRSIAAKAPLRLPRSARTTARRSLRKKRPAAWSVTTSAVNAWMSVLTAPTSPSRYRALRTVIRPCTLTLSAMNAATARSSVRGRVNPIKTKSPSLASPRISLTAATPVF